MFKKDSSGAPDSARPHVKSEPRSSPDSSTDRWGCPQCGEGHSSESLLVEHLANDHQIRVVSPGPPPGSALTRCPVCRKFVSDLSHHFALDHGDNGGPQQVKSINVGAASVTRIIPIVLPSKQPGSKNSVPKYSHHTSGDVTIIPMPSKSNNFTTDERSSDSNDNPMNLTVTRKANSSAAEDSGSETASVYGTASQLERKRRKQTHVPEQSKDEKYWARRLKNNEAAKKSRDMRIKREKVIFEENVRLENMVKELQTENNMLSTENKELHLKMGIVLDENERLKSLLGHDRSMIGQ